MIARIVIGWREREREVEERRSQDERRERIRRARARSEVVRPNAIELSRRMVIDGDDVERRQAQRRLQQAKWARENPDTRRTWRAKKRDRDNATARELYAKKIEAARASSRERQQRWRDRNRGGPAIVKRVTTKAGGPESTRQVQQGSSVRLTEGGMSAGPP